MENFGVAPTIGWQLDTFGHASAQVHTVGLVLERVYNEMTSKAQLSALAGFDGLFFARIDWEDYMLRSISERLEFVWQPSRSMGAASNIFSHALFSELSQIQRS